MRLKSSCIILYRLRKHLHAYALPMSSLRNYDESYNLFDSSFVSEFLCADRIICFVYLDKRKWNESKKPKQTQVPWKTISSREYLTYRHQRGICLFKL